MLHALVTGAAGFIGSHLAQALLQRGWQVTGVDNYDPFYARSLKEQNAALLRQHPGFALLEADLSNPDALNRVLQGKQFTVVFHLAAKAGVLPSIQDPAAYLRHNVDATYQLLEWMRATGHRKLVFASSSSVYGNCPELPFREDGAHDRPISPYAMTKRSCELMTHTWHHLHGLDVVNLRFFTVIGPRQRPDLALRKFVQLALAGQPIQMYGDGSTARDYTYVGDTVDGVMRAAEYVLATDRCYEIINLGNRHPVSLKDMIATVYRVLEIAPNVQQLPMQPGDVDITYADITRAQTLLGYNPQTSFEEGVRRFVAWYRQQAQG